MDIEEHFSGSQLATLSHARELLLHRMKGHEKRYRHSLGVAQTSFELAQTYGVDTFDAAFAGLVHDWDKVLDDHELVVRCLRYGIKVYGSPSQALPLLHGPVAARELSEIFPEISSAAIQAVDRHTVAAVDMTPLDMVVFVADCIEPNRHGDYADTLRAEVGKVSLDRLFFDSFAQGLVYVIKTGRYLYPKSVEIYNHYAALL